MTPLTPLQSLSFTSEKNQGRKVFLNEGFSEAFCDLMDLAKTHDCQFLRLDRDGDSVEGLPTFDW